MNSKKNTPIVILRALEPFLKKSDNHFISVDSKDDLIRFSDNDENSDFYFHIKKYELKNGKHQVLISYKPFREDTVSNTSNWVDSGKIGAYFEVWFRLLKTYDSIQSPYDDPITESFQEDYFSEFEFVDEDQDNPLKPQQIIFLDSYFEEVENKLESHLTEANASRISELKEDISELRENLAAKTKVWVAQKTSWIWAKLTKLGPKVMKDILKEGKKELITKAVTNAIEYTQNLL